MVTIIHLSDIHIAKATDLDHIATDRLIGAIRGCSESNTVVLAFSGDIAFSGKPDQYQLASELIRSVVASLEKDGKKVEVVVVPGNHDLDFESSVTHPTLVRGIVADAPPSLEILHGACACQKHFFEFTSEFSSNSAGWAGTSHAYEQYLEVQGHKVQISAINTAICSQLEEEPGKLFVAPEALPTRHADASCHIAIMHHPLHWLHETVRQGVHDWTSRECDVVLVGHEHSYDHIQSSRRAIDPTLYISAHPLSDKRAAAEGFQAITLRLAERKVSTIDVIRSLDDYSYANEITTDLPDKRGREQPVRPNRDFLQSLESLSVGPIYSGGKQLNHSSIFVYPDLRVVPPRVLGEKTDDEFVDGVQFVLRLIEMRLGLIVGEDHSGKTFFLRQLFKDLLSRGFAPLFMEATDFAGKSVADAFKHKIQHSFSLADARTYFEIPKDSRAVIVDDIDGLPDAHKAIGRIRDYCDEHFGVAVFGCEDLWLLNDPLSGNPDGNALNITTAHILPMSHTKRAALIDKWVEHDEHCSDVDGLNRKVSLDGRLNELLGTKAVPAIPMAITMILESMDNRDSVDESTGAFGYHCHRLILQNLKTAQDNRGKSGRNQVTDDMALELLGRIAYRCYEERAEYLSVERAREIAAEMRDDLYLSFHINDCIDTLVEADLLRRNGGETLCFSFPYVYQYSIAKLLQSWLNSDLEEAVRETVVGLIQEMHHEVSAGVLIFFTFLTRDSKTIDLVVEHANQVYESLPICEFGPAIDKFAAAQEVSSPGSDPNKNRADLNIAKDKKVRNRGAEAKFIARVRENSREPAIEFNRALQCIQVLGQVLRAYPTKLSGQQKKAVAGACYNLGFRTLTAMIKHVEGAEKVMEEYFRDLSTDENQSLESSEFMAGFEREVKTLVRATAYAIVRRIARAVGSVHLRRLYTDLKVDGGEVGVELVNRAIGLDLLNELKPALTVELFEKYRREKKLVASAILQRLSWEYLFLHAVGGSDRQRILQSMGMIEHPLMLSSKIKKVKKRVRHSNKPKAQRKRK